MTEAIDVEQEEKAHSNSYKNVEQGEQTIANSNGAINEAMMEGANAVDISDEQTKKGIELMTENWNIINSKYGWMKNSNCCCKILWKLYYFITGFLAILFLFLPLLLFILIFIILLFLFPLYAIQCGKCCKISFKNYIRVFLGKQRLHLLTYKPSQQGIFWHIRNRIIGTMQIFELLTFVAQNPGELYQHEQTYKNLFGGKQYPYLFAVGITDYDQIYQQIMRSNNKRNGNFVGQLQTPHNDAAYYLHVHALSTKDFRHKFAKKVTIILNEISPAVAHFKAVKLPDNFMESTGYWKSIATVTKHTPHIFFTALFWVWFDVVLTKKESELVGASVVNAGFLTFPPWLHTILANKILLRKANGAIEMYKQLFIKYGNNGEIKKLDKLYAYCDEIKVDGDIGLMCTGMGIIFAGGQAHFEKAVKRYSENKEREKKLFNENARNYIYELARYKDNIPNATNIALEEHKYTILGNDYIFPENTLISSSIAVANEDKKYFDKPMEFGVDRDYKQIMTFNCVEEFYQRQNWDKFKDAPRFCPGHDTAFIFLKALIQKLHTL
eukprot:359339_1